LQYGDKIKEIYGGELNTTNQRMELTACIKALEQIKQPGCKIHILTDSAYLVNCMHKKWYIKWLRNGWKNSQNKPVENRDLWEKLLTLISSHLVKFSKVSGHSGNKLNDRADALARKGIEQVRSYI